MQQQRRSYLVYSLTDLLQTHIQVKLLLFKVRSLLIKQFHLNVRGKSVKLLS